MENKILVSAIVSVYNSEKYIEELLVDLTSQTLYENGSLEIVIVNSGSEENEEAIIQKWQRNHDNITYLKTTERETIYQAWNRGILAAKGEYVTNANTDDRHREDALEIMYNHFISNPDADVVYVNSLKTEVPNDTFYSTVPKTGMAWIDFDPDLILFGCYIGPQPMWKKSLHDRFGLFDDNLKVVGDYEFWLRIGKKARFHHINEFLGLYYFHSESAEHRNNSLTEKENDEVQKFYVLRYLKSEKEIARVKSKVEIVATQIGNDFYRQNAFKLLDYCDKRLTGTIDKSTQVTNKEELISSLKKNERAVSFNILEDYINTEVLEVNKELQTLQNFVFSDDEELYYQHWVNVFQKYSKGLEMDGDKNQQLDKLVEIGIEHLEQKQFSQAKEKFLEVLSISANNMDALNNLSVAEAFLGNYEQSAKYIKKVFELDPENKIATHNLNYLDSLVHEMSAPRSENEQIQTAEELIEAGNLDDAEQILMNLVALDNKNLDALNDLSVVKILRGQYEEAIKYIDSVLELDSGNGTAIENLSTLESLVDKQLKDVRNQIEEDGNERN